ncbi:hypothetical protein Tco_0127795 [Tanacetum coccineum]
MFNSTPMDSYGMPATRVNLVEYGVTCDGSPKVSNSSPLVSPSTTINVPRELYSIDVAATFGVPKTTVGDLYKLINDIKAGKHDELLSGMTNDDRMETMDALGIICNSIQTDSNNADVIPYKVSHVDDSINLNVDESTIPSDPIIQFVDINTKSTSYAGAVGASTKDQPKVNSNFRTIVVDPVFDGVNISIPRKVVEKVNSEADLVDVFTISIPSIFEDGFIKETIRVEYEWRPPRCDKCKIFGHVHDHCSKKVVVGIQKSLQLIAASCISTASTLLVVRYEPKATTKVHTKQGSYYVVIHLIRPPILKTTGNSSKKDNLSMSNSFSALNEEEEEDEEDVENVYDESANLIQNTKAGGSSYFTAAAG